MDHIDMPIVDPNITLDSLNLTLGSFYQDEIVVEPADVISVIGKNSIHAVAKFHISSQKSLIENLNFDKIHISEISIFTKFIFLKSQFSQNS